ncbi:MAG: DUF92 domain-containing protein [Chloroflexi bacterium HGW-Chloroflexi-8]|nr:MAG: DUF92 domain-containing protein [Chloroflexi bacterium HGW-Chloroflexi-8]
MLSDISLWQLLSGVVLALLISWLSFRFRLLSFSGAIGATILGIIVFGLGGLRWAILLLGFFISSSGLSKLLGRRKQNVTEKFAKGSTRDIGQVFANGGVAGVFVIFHLFFPGEAWPWLAFAGSLAAVNADTWATELGVLSITSPIHIISGKKVEKGTSGGISIEGTLAAFLGSLLMGGLAVAAWPRQIIPFENTSWWLPVLTIAFSGLFGSLVDSFLGARFQTIFYCPTCKKETERFPLHLCNTRTEYLRGLRWMNNDWVNLICALSGGVMMLLASL